MRYYQINENTEDIENVIKSQPFLKQFREMRLYHGTDSISEVMLVPFKLRNKPKDTPDYIHNALNAATKEKFGVPVRSLLFTYPDSDGVYQYGNTIMIVPNGSFRLFLVNGIHDLTVDMELDNITSKRYERWFNEVVDTLYERGFDREGIELVLHKLESSYSYVTRYYSGSIIDAFSSFIIHGLDDGLDDEDYGSIPDIEGAVRNTVKEVVEWNLMQLGEEYADSITEVENDGDFKNSNLSEIMVYAPNGFYAIPEGTDLFNELNNGKEQS